MKESPHHPYKPQYTLNNQVIYPKCWIYSLYTLYTQFYVIPYNGLFIYP